MGFVGWVLHPLKRRRSVPSTENGKVKKSSGWGRKGKNAGSSLIFAPCEVAVFGHMLNPEKGEPGKAKRFCQKRPGAATKISPLGLPRKGRGATDQESHPITHLSFQTGSAQLKSHGEVEGNSSSMEKSAERRRKGSPNSRCGRRSDTRDRPVMRTKKKTERHTGEKEARRRSRSSGNRATNPLSSWRVCFFEQKWPGDKEKSSEWTKNELERELTATLVTHAILLNEKGPR